MKTNNQIVPFKKIILFSALIVMFHIQASEIFGEYGTHGEHGQSGAHGYHGEDITIWASSDGIQKFDLRGGHGENASSRGEDGRDATSCYHGRPEYSLEGASGGDAGSGGSGGDGGNGGDAVIYYTDLSELKNIMISNNGGRGGISSSGGRGGEGCSCEVDGWSHEWCSTDDEGEKKCWDQSFSCTKGARGRDGDSPSDGSSGQRGSITLIKDLSELPTQIERQEATLDKFLSNRFYLSSIIWSSKNGAKQLFHPDSSIDDYYREYSHLAEKFFELDWEVKRSVEPFKHFRAEINFYGKNINFAFDYSHNFLHVGHYDRSDAKVERYIITKAFLAEEILKLEAMKPVGQKKELKIKIEDPLYLTKEVKNSVYLTLDFERFLIGDKEVFSGLVEEKFLKIDENGIEIALGELAGDFAEKLKSKKVIKLEIEITRSLNGKSLKKQFTVKHKI
jgi:hypothetical protein